ncbi:FG-GAP repeat domain-containing protein [Glaciecola siphonariae]|uniref:FG-GAP repeat domain-containing protein n=1 Tax=Glaciecola siphonariae TaxID=521012 RepID=A0ABV9LY99_9ALTE
MQLISQSKSTIASILSTCIFSARMVSARMVSLCIVSIFITAGCKPSPPQSDESIARAPASQVTTVDVQTAMRVANEPWQYIQVDDSKQMWGDWDEPEWLRYFGLAAGDVDGDGLKDIVSGRYVYLQQNTSAQPKGSQWRRLDLGDNVDSILVLDVDGDSNLDVIAQALPNLYWYELLDSEAGTFKREQIGQVPATTHVNSQGFTTADLVGDDSKEFVIAGNGNLYAFKADITDSGAVVWTEQLIAANTSDEGIGVGDIDGDGDMDVAAGRRPGNESEPKEIIWFENPGHMDRAWKEHFVGRGGHPIDRVEIADLNGDGKGDIVFTEERYPGLQPDAQMAIFIQEDAYRWNKQVLVTQYSMNNLDIGDVDQDGDLDIVTAEHKGEELETELWLNDGKARFKVVVVDSGKESHLGTQLFDIDDDGDLDLISAGWDQHQFVHVWLNPLISDVEIAQTVHLQREHFKITTPSATYLFDKKGGGFSSIVDASGNDWVNFKLQPWGDYPAAAAGGFRGIPNAVHNQGDDSGAGHPGFDTMSSVLISSDSIESTSKSGSWKWRYTFFPEGVKMQVLQTPDDANYWFLYEGTPGGRYDLSNTVYGTDALGWHDDQPDFYLGSIKEGQFNWVYFSHAKAEQSLYIAQLTKDDTTDIMSYLGNTQEGAQSPDGMVVFGFGRDAAGSALMSGNHSFFIGLAPMQVVKAQQHTAMSEYISESVKQYSTE